MIDPYATLGVPRDAPQTDIKRAYQRASSSAHPDRGGNHEAQAELNLAYALICTADERAKFDAGEKQGPTQSLEQQARQFLCQAMRHAMGQSAVGDHLIERLRRIVEQKRAELAARRSEIGKQVSQLEQRLKRLKCAASPDFLGDMLRNEISAARAGVAEADGLAEMLICATGMLDAYQYAADPSPPPGATRWTTVMSFTNTSP